MVFKYNLKYKVKKIVRVLTEELQFLEYEARTSSKWLEKGEKKKERYLIMNCTSITVLLGNNRLSKSLYFISLCTYSNTTKIDMVTFKNSLVFAVSFISFVAFEISIRIKLVARGRFIKDDI